MKFFLKKIKAVKEEYETEKKLAEETANVFTKENRILTELEWIRNIAQKIDHENHLVLQKHGQIKDEIRAIRADKEILLREVLIKKKKYGFMNSKL